MNIIKEIENGRAFNVIKVDTKDGTWLYALRFGSRVDRSSYDKDPAEWLLYRPGSQMEEAVNGRRHSLSFHSAKDNTWWYSKEDPIVKASYLLQEAHQALEAGGYHETAHKARELRRQLNVRCTPDCPGWVFNSEKYSIERCDECDSHDDDSEAFGVFLKQLEVCSRKACKVAVELLSERMS